ncbi:hypothetical protein MKZ38_006949 [Zalerion maritima]|uniref:Nudix hydrolase domain-containing protein n=1 Tax=Zalerion maritima TaxID=339359 RepID=A0AAD5WTV0_9PEZI|nr:hypothetical protein MKZ38_006949 [Zalerion maritima]
MPGPSFLEKFGDVPLTVPDGLEMSMLEKFHPLKTWIDQLHHSLSLQHQDASHPFHSKPYALRSLAVKSHTMFGPSRIGFANVEAVVKNDDGNRLPATVFLRGPSVAMLFMLLPDGIPSDSTHGDDERYVVLTVQPRVAAGSMAFAELPAGMVDEKNEFSGTAAREIYEELGIRIEEKDLLCLSDMVEPTPPEGQKDEGLSLAMFPSAGGCDEFIKIFMCEKRVEREKLDEWRGKQTGLREDGEIISLRLVRYEDLWKEGARDSKALSAVALYEGLKREGKI